MKYLPLFFDLRGQSVLLVGGGDIALRKARLLQRAGAEITVVAPDILPALRALAESSDGLCQQRRFAPGDIDARRLVVAATSAPEVNAAVSELCKSQSIPVNVVDQPALCSVTFPAIVDRDPILVAVGSGGGAPVLTRRIRALLETTIPASYGALAGFAARFRRAVKDGLQDPVQRRRFWEKVFDGPVAEMVLAGRPDDAEALLKRALADPDSTDGGEVYLVGAGPGDPDLLTFKAHRLMQKADIVLYDRLVAPAIVDLCRADAERLYVGKRRDVHALPQQEINQLLLHYASQGRRVLRLKGGDPFIFGRGGEEIELLAERGIPFQVVPGVTAASGCACYAGIPLTHRDHAQSVRFVTGHLKDGSTDLDWAELARPAQTVVFYMGLAGLPTICRSLVAAGRSAETPIALIQQGTTQQQRVVTGTLNTIVARVAAQDIHAPTLLIVGEVVKLQQSLAWFGDSSTR